MVKYHENPDFYKKSDNSVKVKQNPDFNHKSRNLEEGKNPVLYKNSALTRMFETRGDENGNQSSSLEFLFSLLCFKLHWVTRTLGIL